MKKWILAAISCSLLACQATLGQSASIQIVNLPTEKIAVATELAVSQNPGAKIQLNFQFEPPEPADFKTQLACTVSSHLQSIRIYLIDGSTSLGASIPFSISPLNIAPKVVPNPSTFYSVNKTVTGSGQNQSVTLSNVNTGSYYLAVAAYDGLNGTGTNITSVLASLSFANVNGDNVIVTDGGGNAANPGRVEIGSAAAGFPILNSSSPNLTVNLKLGILCL